VSTIARHIQLIQDRFSPTRFQLYEQFATYRIEPNQTAHQAGNELRRLYLGYLQLQDQDVTQFEPVIGPTLTARLIDALPRYVANHLRTELLRNPNTTWPQVQTLADQFLQGNQTKAPAATQHKEKQLCSIHGYCAHSDADCKTKQYRRQPIGDTRRYPTTCFGCGKPGHQVANCPHTTPQGNDRG
jgi:hypothetical protein